MCSFGIKDKRAVTVTKDDLRSSLSVLNNVLENHGILRMPEIVAKNGMPPSPASSGSPSAETESTVQVLFGKVTVIEERPSLLAPNIQLPRFRARSASRARVTGLEDSQVVTTSSLSQARVDRVNERYRPLLNHVIKSAQSERGQVRL